MRVKVLAGLMSLAWSLAPPAARADEPGYLGVLLAPVPEELSAHVKAEGGALVSRVVPGSPAENAGLKRFDVIVSVNGAGARSPDEVRGRIQEAKRGDLVKLGVVRGAETLALEATLADPPAELPEVKPETKPDDDGAKEKEEESHKGFLGIGSAEVPPLLAHHLALPEGTGIVVGDVWKGSPAEKAGIEAMDVLTAVDGKAIRGPSDFRHVFSQKKAGDKVKIDLIHKGEKKTLEVTLAPRPKDLPHLEDPRGARGWSDFLGPRSSRKGKVILRGPDGAEHVIPLPESLWKADDLFKDLEEKLGKFKDVQIPELKRSLRESLRDLEEKLKDEKDEKDADRDIRWSRPSRSTSSVVRSVDGEFDITVKDVNGHRTVTVLKEGKAIATDLPYKELDTLPPEVKGRVQKMVENLKIGPAGKEVVPHLEEEQKIRA